MSKLERHTLNQRVYFRLQKMLLQGEIAPGTQLDERELAERMGVSRTPLREAIAHLVKEGIVEYRPYRGNFARTFTVQEVNDLYTVRRALESLAVRLAIPKLSQEDIERIGAILDKVHDALERGDMEMYSEADGRFHHTIIQLTRNQTLIEVLDRLGSQIQMVRAYANRDPRVVERTHRERPLILAALAARDADAAAALMEEHIDGVRRAVIDQMAELQWEEMNGTTANPLNAQKNGQAEGAWNV
jgi:DNA-binding GntR family transcriptional regulator